MIYLLKTIYLSICGHYLEDAPCFGSLFAGNSRTLLLLLVKQAE